MNRRKHVYLVEMKENIIKYTKVVDSQIGNIWDKIK